MHYLVIKVFLAGMIFAPYYPLPAVFSFSTTEHDKK
jgi:hypothetical protein